MDLHDKYEVTLIRQLGFRVRDNQVQTLIEEDSRVIEGKRYWTVVKVRPATHHEVVLWNSLRVELESHCQTQLLLAQEEADAGPGD